MDKQTIETKKRGKAPLIIGILLFICVACVVCCASCYFIGTRIAADLERQAAEYQQRLDDEQKQKEEAEKKAAEEAKAKDKKDFENAPKAPFSFSFDKLKWDITKVENKGSRLKSLYPSIVKDCTISASEKYVFVYIDLFNGRTEGLGFLNTGTLATVIDKDGKQYSANTTGNFYNCLDITKTNYLGPLGVNPNTSESFVQIYKLPANASGLRLKVKSDKDDSYQYVNLGI
jgi:hypothetical protein